MKRQGLFLFIITFSIFLISQSTNAEMQLKVRLAFIVESNPIRHEREDSNAPFNWREASEIKVLAIGLIRFYQLFISTQDVPTCSFHPSCSQFGMLCIQKYGFFRGILLTGDRLLRCNGMGLDQHYSFDEMTERYLDPVEHYSPEALKQ